MPPRRREGDSIEDLGTLLVDRVEGTGWDLISSHYSINLFKIMEGFHPNNVGLVELIHLCCVKPEKLTNCPD